MSRRKRNSSASSDSSSSSSSSASAQARASLALERQAQEEEEVVTDILVSNVIIPAVLAVATTFETQLMLELSQSDTPAIWAVKLNDVDEAQFQQLANAKIVSVVQVNNFFKWLARFCPDVRQPNVHSNDTPAAAAQPAATASTAVSAVTPVILSQASKSEKTASKALKTVFPS